MNPANLEGDWGRLLLASERGGGNEWGEFIFAYKLTNGAPPAKRFLMPFPANPGDVRNVNFCSHKRDKIKIKPV